MYYALYMLSAPQGNAPSGLPGQRQGGRGQGDQKDKKEQQKKKWEPPLPTSVGKRKKKKGPDAASKLDRKSTRLNSSHSGESRMPSSA